MPAEKPEYSPLPDWTTIANKLVQRYPEKFDGINVAMVRPVMITNKDQKEGKHVWELTTVPYPMRLDLNYDFYITMNGKSWAEAPKTLQQWYVADSLHAISREGDAKVVPFDLKDFSSVIRNAGVDWNRGGEVPDLLGEVPIRWKEPEMGTVSDE